MIMHTQGVTMDSGSTSDKPDVVSVPDVQESGTETKPDASLNKHLQFSYDVIHCYSVFPSWCNIRLQEREPCHPIRLQKDLNSALWLAHTVDAIATRSCKNLEKCYPANLCKVPQNTLGPQGPQNTLWQPQGALKTSGAPKNLKGPMAPITVQF